MLTKREKEVLELGTRGLSRTEIAANLFVSHHMSKKHFENIKKLTVKNKVQASNKFRQV
jgi:DNA-binding CsgD family transcriptional regulator